MTKLEVATLVKERTGISQRQAMAVVELFLESVRSALHEGEKVSLVGFGTFFIKEKEGRSGRNPKTGQQIGIPAKKVIVFKPGKEFRDETREAPAAPQV